MSTVPPRTPDPRVVSRASAAVFASFFLAGLNFATWASRLPAIRDGLGLSQGQVGLLLLVGSIGSLVALPLSGLVVERLGAARTVLLFAVLNATGLTVGAVGVALGEVVVVAGGLLLFGVGTGVWDASMNIEGAAVERELGRSVMPRYHAGFSFGTVAAAALSAVLAGLDVPVVVHVPAVLVLSTLAVVVAVRAFLPEGTAGAADGHGTHGADVAPTTAAAGDGGGPRRGAGGALDAWREPRTLLIGLVVLGAALTEGAANDWVSLAVVDGFRTSDAVGAIGFGVFVAAMTAGRIAGTRLLDRYGRVTVLRAAAVLAVVGLVAFALVGPLWLALVGVVAWGLGAALGFPVGMSAAADDPARATARVSVVSTIGYAAFLAGPPLLGFLAEHVGYRTALLAVVVPVAVSLLVVRAAAPLPGPQALPAPEAPPAPEGARPASRGAAD